MVTDKRVEVEWSNLPNELWPRIASHLSSTVDILRFRSTCTTWRSAAPLPPPSSRTLFPPQILIPHGEYTLLQTRIFRLQPSLTSNKGWIIKVSDSTSLLPIRLLNPFTNYHLSESHESYAGSSKLLNVVNFRYVELVEAYRCHSELYGAFLKSVLFPSSSGARMVFALYQDGTLGVSKIGDDNWTVIDDGISRFDDVIVRSDQLYVVDESGTVSWVDCSSLKLVQYSPALCSFGKKKQFVECGGSLYVVDLYGGRDVVDVRVYRLDEDWGWSRVEDLGDVVFVLGKDSNFSLDARDYYGCEGNCVYFYSSERVRAFSLGTSKFKPPKLFWPCPSLFDLKFNL